MTVDNPNHQWIGKRTPRPDGADKVTGRAAYAADTNMPGMIWGKVLRSPHAHARIKSIDASKAEALPGVHAVITSKDIVDFPIAKGPVMLGIQDMRWMCRNVMARDKALFHGHPVAAVAATSQNIAAEALKLIKVDYEVLPWAIDVEDAIKPGAPILHDHIKFQDKPSNIAGTLEHKKGDVEAGFKQADVIVERSFKTEAVHQGYIEPHACLVSVTDGKATIWSSSQGQFMVRAMSALLTGMTQSDIRAIPAEIGGGFGGKTIIYLEPLALMLARKTGKPVKMVMSREEVFRASGPTSGSKSIGQDRRQEGRHDHSRPGHLLAAGRRLPRLADPRRRRLRLRALRHRERPHGGLRRRLQSLEGRGLPRAGRADRRLCRRVRARRAGREAQHGSARAPPQELRQAGHQGGARSALSGHGLPGDAEAGARPSALQGAAQAQPGPRRGERLLVQRRRRIERPGERQRGRLGRGHDRPSRHRRLRAPRRPTSPPSSWASTTTRCRC